MHSCLSLSHLNHSSPWVVCALWIERAGVCVCVVYNLIDLIFMTPEVDQRDHDTQNTKHRNCVTSTAPSSSSSSTTPATMSNTDGSGGVDGSQVQVGGNRASSSSSSSSSSNSTSARDLAWAASATLQRHSATLVAGVRRVTANAAQPLVNRAAQVTEHAVAPAKRQWRRVKQAAEAGEERLKEVPTEPSHHDTLAWRFAHTNTFERRLAPSCDTRPRSSSVGHWPFAWCCLLA